MRLRDRINNILHSRAFRAFVCGGTVGVLIDTDHFIADYLFPQPAYPEEMARFLHGAYFTFGLLIMCALGTCLVGLYIYRIAILRCSVDK